MSLRRQRRVGLRQMADEEDCTAAHLSDRHRHIYFVVGSSTDSFVPRVQQHQGRERCRKTGRGNLRDPDHQIARGHATGNRL